MILVSDPNGLQIFSVGPAVKICHPHPAVQPAAAVWTTGGQQ